MMVLRSKHVGWCSWACGLAVVLLFGAGVSVSGCGEPAKQEPTPAKEVRASGPNKALDPGKWGPYKVGVTTFRVADDSRKDDKGKPRPMVIEVWYPIKDAAAKGATDIYDVNKDAPSEAQDVLKKAGITLPTLAQNAYRDAESFKAEGPYPLILFSHGSGGIRFQSVFLCPHLASHGYVVASVDHIGNTMYDLVIEKDAGDRARLLRSATDRPYDLTFVVDFLKKEAAKQDGRFGGMIDFKQLGVTGHSFGGLTSLLATGVFKDLKVSIPQTPLSSVTPGVGAEDMYKVHFMVMASVKDNTLDYKAEQENLYTRLIKPAYMKADRYLFSLKRGGHFTYSDICAFDLAKFSKRLGFGNAENILRDGCAKENTEITFAHDLIRRYSTAMFNVYLRGSEGSRKYIKVTNDTELEVREKRYKK